MRLLPNELWLIIFQAALDPSPYEFPLLEPTYFPLAIASVCKQWRNIIMNTPAFWCRFTILDRHPDLDRIGRYLARSGQIPLSIEITHSANAKAPAPELMIRNNAVLSTIVQHRRKQKLKELHITGPASFDFFDPRIFQDLEVLSIKSRGHKLLGTDGLSRLPMTRLKELRLELHLDQLLTLNECAVMLANMPRLQRCYVDALYSGDPNIPEISCFNLQQLHLLLRDASHGEGQCNLVQFLDAAGDSPLNDLGIDWLVEHPGDRSPLGGLEHSLSQWSITMRSLRLSYLPLSDVGIGRCLTSLPNLESVCLRYPLHGSNDPITYSLIRQLGYRSVHLECTGTQFEDEDLVELLDKVEICYLLTSQRRSDWLYEQQGSSQLTFIYS